ncbi:hypothetical protein CXB51_034728 [Gossypium anomalum]|uniref:DUF7745 domain-containing protein n=1 Tax=Gossypium anomalum TaxID=47600 RepID=A0A8J5Y1H6_9ROSI|nr:hypothetical protein CXB51_034728 [Gossypium anomalum]
MENGLLDRVEGNANVHRWSEQTQLEKGDSIVAEYMSELSDCTRISVTQNNLQELKKIWNQWGNETKQLFYGNYGDLPYLLDIQVDEHLFRALAQFWNPAYSCFTFGEVDLVPTVEEYTALLHCPRFQIDRIYSRAASVPTFWKKLMTITGMSEQWITARIKEKGECKALGYVDEITTDLFHRLGKRVTSVPAILAETFRSLGTCRKAGAGRRKMLSGELRGLFQFVPVTHGLAQSEFVYRGADYKNKVGEISNAWNKTYRLKGIAISPATTPKYIEWRGRRVNHNIPKANVEGARPIEEYLRVMPSELEIMRQEFERKNLELEKKITKLEEEKMYLSLDVDVQKKEKEVQEGRTRAEYWERKFQEMQSQNLALEEESKGLKTKVIELGKSLRWHQNHNPTVEVEERDYVIGEAIAQIRELAEYVQDMAIRADVLSLMYSSSSDVGRELALLLDRVKALGLRAKAYL